MKLVKNGGYSRQMLITLAVALAFLITLCVFVTGEMKFDEVARSNKGAYVTLMVINCLLLVGGFIYCSLEENGKIFSIIVCVVILLGVADSYLVLFRSFTSNRLIHYFGLFPAMGIYYLWRRRNTLTQKGFYFVMGAVFALLGINLVFGVDNNTGAKLWVNVFGITQIQPGEFIKLLLIILGASCYRNVKRGILYFVTSVISCVVLAGLHDLGGALVIFCLFLMTTYLIFDSKLLSITIIAISAVLFVIAILSFDYARMRLSNWFGAMELERGSQQRYFIIGNLLAGVRGLGFQYHSLFTEGFSSGADGALAGVMAVYGFPMLMVVFAAYAFLIAIPIYNRSIYPSSFFILAQFSVYISVQAILNFGGSIDILPFTGVVAPFVSMGNSSGICMWILCGLAAAVVNPKIPFHVTNE